MIFSDVSGFSLFPTAGRVYVWRQPREAYTPDHLLSIVKHEGGSVMVWTAISSNSLGLIVALHGRINSTDALNISGYHVHPMVQAIFPDGDCILHDINDSMIPFLDELQLYKGCRGTDSILNKLSLNLSSVSIICPIPVYMNMNYILYLLSIPY